MCVCSHNFTNFAVAEPLSLEIDGLRGQEPSSLSFVQRGHIRQIFWREDFWRGFRYHFKRLAFTLKFTKISPFFYTISLIINKLNQIFIAFSEALFKAIFQPFSTVCHVCKWPHKWASKMKQVIF